jgi:hypothetical protein
MTLEFIVLLAAAASAVGYFLVRLFKLFKTWFHFITDWYGTEDTPGVIERLAEGNKRFDYIEGELKIIKEELFNNSGSSLRDAIDRIESAVAKPKRSSSPNK